MADAAPEGDDIAAATLRLTVGGLPVEARLEVPVGPVAPQAVLPALMRLVDAVVAATEAAAARRGRPVSCAKGCGACCRQLVPVAGFEARHIRAVVHALPPERRATVEARFAEASRRLAESGLRAALLAPARRDRDAAIRLGLDYFALGIACPFLEEEACSIHADRPLACREYLVTSPPAACARPGDGAIEPLRVPGMAALARTLDASSDRTPGGAGAWVPLTLALEWAAAHPDTAAPRPGTVWAEAFVGGLARLPVPQRAGRPRSGKPPRRERRR